MTTNQPTATAAHELVLTRLIDASPETLYRCWTEPSLLKQWFAGKPFMVAVVTFEPEAGKTRYTARARHWNAETKAQHEAMGFPPGAGASAQISSRRSPRRSDAWRASSEFIGTVHARWARRRPTRKC